MAHTCKSLLIHCMDFRFVSKIRDWMDSQSYLGDCDVVSLAGACKGIVDGGDTANVILRQIELSNKLHHVCRVIILHHASCGAYAAVHTFADEAEELAKQTEDMRFVENTIKARFPEIEVLKVWVCFTDESKGEVEFKTIQ